MPKRIQMHRRKGGWRKDNPHAVIVSRPHEFANPFRVGDPDPFNPGVVMDNDLATANFRNHALTDAGWANVRAQLRGKDLACWCALDQTCHADVLLEIANADPA